MPKKRIQHVLVQLAIFTWMCFILFLYLLINEPLLSYTRVWRFHAPAYRWFVVQPNLE